MRNRQRRFLITITCVPVALVLIAFGYMTLMRTLEGESRTLAQSMEWAAETLTTTGYGRDATWSHPAMVAYVIVIQFVGLLAVFSLFPLFLLPFLEERFEARLPTQLPPLSGHLVVYGYGPSVVSLLVEARASGLPTLVVEPDEHQARLAAEAGHRVVHLRFTEATGDLSSLVKAAAIVANAGDDEDAALLVEARGAGYSGPLIVLVDTPSHRQSMVLAGASLAFTSRHAQAAELAARVSERLRPRIVGVEHLSDELTVAELRVGGESEFVGLTVGQARVRQRTGVSLVGVFERGALVPVSAATELSAGTRVIAIGTGAAIANLGRALVPLVHGGATLVIGDGVVAQRTREILMDAGEHVRWLADDQGADFHGDPLDPEFMTRVGLASCAYVVVALENDARTLLTLAVVRSIAPSVRVVAGVDQSENQDRTLRAGADATESLAAVSGRVLLFHVTGETPAEEHALAVDLLTPPARERAITIAEADLPLGTVVVAVRRRGGGDEIEIGPDSLIGPGDALVICRSRRRARIRAD